MKFPRNSRRCAVTEVNLEKNKKERKKNETSWLQHVKELQGVSRGSTGLGQTGVAHGTSRGACVV